MRTHIDAAPVPLWRQVGWGLFGLPSIRTVAWIIYTSISPLLRPQGAPLLRSPHKTVTLYRRRFGELEHYDHALWKLDDEDGTSITRNHWVIEFHIESAELARAAEQCGKSQFQILREDINWIFVLLEHPDYDDIVALVGRTHLRRLAELLFGVEFREESPSWYLSLDTFHRQLLLMFYADDWYRKVLRATDLVAVGAVSMRAVRQRAQKIRLQNPRR